MSQSVLIERRSSPGGEEDLRSTAVSDLPLDETSDADVPSVGTVLDERYEITGILGQGGMGHVLAARHVVLGQRIAIKVLRREMTRDEEIVERFRREARAASAIGHSGIVAVKDFGTLPSGASYYVMEHVEGVGLADALDKDGRFSIERAVDVVKQMADALGAAHAAGVVHRDVKPDNVILTSFHGRPDHVKVLDFGIAKLDFASRLSGAHRVLGTPAYMSPEQARGQTLDQRCDVYALGVLFYELLAGRVPFDDPRPLEVLRQQIQVAAPSVQLVRPEVPDGIAAVIARCLEKSPDARPESMAALVELLAPFATQRSTAFAPSTPSPVPASRPSPRVDMALAVTLMPVVRSVPARPSPTPAAAPASPRRSNGVVMVLGLVLTAIGVAALAAAGGILARERSDELAAPAPVIDPSTPPAEIVAAAPPAIASAPPAARAPEPPVLAPAPVPSSASIASPAPPVHAHPTHAAPVASSAPTEVAPPATPHVEHPTIRVIDPWDDPG